MNERTGYRSIKMITHDEDKRLVVLALSGDQSAYNDLLRKYKPVLYTAAKRRLSTANVEDLEDIVMIVLGNAFVKLKQYNPEKSKLFTWMVSCLHNYINNIPKQKKRISTYSLDDMYPSNSENDLVEYEIPDEDNFDKQYDIEQSYKLLRTLMKRLPDEIYQVMFLKFFREQTNKEIAAAVGIAEHDVWYRVKRGKDLLKKYSDGKDLF